MTIGEKVSEKLQEPMGLEEFVKYLKLILWIAALGGSWAVMYAKLDSVATGLKINEERGERMERYLSSKDANYWQTVKQLE